MATRYSRSKFVRASAQLLAKHSVKDVARVMAAEIVAQRLHRDLDLIMQALGQELLRTQRHAEVTVTTAHPLPAAALTTLKRHLQQYLAAETITMQTAVDESLKGGAVVQTPRGVLRASVQDHLHRLKQL